MMGQVEVRARNAMLGLAMGDAISWSAMYHRSHLLPPWTRRLRREIDASEEETGVTTQALPFSLNRDAAVFLPGPSDDTEWAAFSALLWMDNHGDVSDEALISAWRALADQRTQIRGKTSIKAALLNVTRGLLPPVTGQDHPSFFDDAGMCRAVPIGLLHAGRPEMAAAAARKDASVTNAEDGVYAAQAIATACALAITGHSSVAMIDAVLKSLPRESWIARTAASLNGCDFGTHTLVSSVIELSERVVNREYQSGCVAVEILTMALGIVKLVRGDFELGLMAANLVAKTADSLPALVGALTGALSDQPVTSDYWRMRLARLHGICIPDYRGMDYLKLADNLAGMAAKNYER